VSSDNKRTDDYWMGVRDALRMVDSFNKWAVRNPGRAKSLDDFIHDGLIAAAKRCESCLSEKLGLSFIMEDHVEANPVSVESPAPEIVPPPEYDFGMDDAAEELFDVIPETSDEIPLEYTEDDAGQEIPIELDDSSISIDSVERIENEPMKDIGLEGPQRDFTTDFVLVEPSALVVDEDDEINESVLDEPQDEPDIEEPEILDEPSLEQETIEKRPVFTWSDYEAAVAPKPEAEPLDSENDVSMGAEDDYIEPPLHEDTYTTNEESIDNPSEQSDAPKVFGLYDEPSINDRENLEEFNDDTDEDSITEIDETDDMELSETTTPVTEPPAPPPPPESEEDEEERKRRARRLFFGS
jgi:hypothetical protein